MKDQLEDFIHRNRNAFDDREPGPKVWKGIEHSMRFSRRPWKNPLVLWRAAAIFFMVLSGYLMLPKEPARADQSLALKEFSDVEAFYFQQISNKVDMIHEFQQNEGLNGFTQDFQQLEAMYLVLKEEMKVRPSQKVKDALVLNLLVRIDLLNQQLHRLEEKKEDGGEEKRST
jgi:hypothetical protein